MLNLSIRSVIFYSVLIHLILAYFIPLGNDEVYYVQYARYPSYHYYDHPLMIGWGIKIFSFNFYFEHPFFYRVFSIISSAISTFCIYKTTLLFGKRKSAIVASILFSTSLYGGIIAGVFAMPDAPMMLFWILSLYIASIIFFSENITDTQRDNLFILFGLTVGLAILSKYHAAYLWIGMLLFILLKRRENFFKWQLYVGVAITGCLFFPIVYWNSQNEWVNFSFYSDRIGVSRHIGFQYLLREIIGEVLYQNPVLWLFLVFQTTRINSFSNFDQKKEFLFLMSFPLLFAFWALSLSRETLPHWSGPAFASIIIIASIGFDKDFLASSIHVWLNTIVSVFIGILLFGILLIHIYPGTIGNKKDPMHYGSGDFTLDMYGWKSSIGKITSGLDQKRMQHLPILSNRWFPAAHIEEYLPANKRSTFFVVGSLQEIHQYHWINKLKGGIPSTDSAIYITPSNYYSDPIPLFKKNYGTIQMIDKFAEERNGKITRYYYTYLLCNQKKNECLSQ